MEWRKAMKQILKRTAIFILLIISISILFTACLTPPKPDEATTILDIEVPKKPAPEEQKKVEDEAVPEDESRLARDPERGIIQGYGNDRISEIQYDARYYFEQYELPRILIEYENEMIEFIETSNADGVDTFVQAAWLTSAAFAIFDDFTPEEEEYALQGFDQRWELIDQKILEYDLGKDHIVDISIEALDENTTAAIVKLYDTGWRPLSTYVAIVYNDDIGLVYFTVERSYGDNEDGSDDPYMFCWVEYEDRGSIYYIDNTKEAFMEAILELILDVVQ